MEENIIKDVRNRFRLNKLEKEINDITIKNIKNLFRLKKGNEAMKYKIIRDIRNLFEYVEEDYYEPVRAGYFSSNNYIEYKSIKVKTTEKHYQLKNILITLNNT